MILKLEFVYFLFLMLWSCYALVAYSFFIFYITAAVAGLIFIVAGHITKSCGQWTFVQIIVK